jgi:hypothetical protein
MCEDGEKKHARGRGFLRKRLVLIFWEGLGHDVLVRSRVALAANPKALSGRKE